MKKTDRPKHRMRIKRAAALFLAAALLLLTACGAGGGDQPEKSSSKKNTENADLTFSTGEPDYPYALSQNDASGTLSVSEAGLESFAARLAEIRCDFPYQEYYGVEELFDRLYSCKPPERHLHSALDADGKLTAEHLADVVRENNRAYLESLKTGTINLEMHTEPEDDLLSRICVLITETVEEMRVRFPEIDWDRVYCNLGNLKVLHEQRISMAMASVDENMVMSLQDSILSLADTFSGPHGIRNTLIHEIMHVLQYGCECEKTENLTVRLGNCYVFSDVAQNALKYYWLVEGAAEKETCLLTGDDPLTYATRIGYIETLDYATFLPDGVPAYFAESIPFYSDPELLLGLLDCETREEKLEASEMMRAMEIMQTMPEDFLDVLEPHTELDLDDEAVTDEIRYRIKPAVCRYFTKQFYRTLLGRVAQGGVTENDLYGLLRLYEGLLDQHLGLWEGRTPEINAPFLTEYAALRGELFDLLTAEGNGVSLERYLSYAFFAGENEINAGLSWLPKKKTRFVFDRVAALDEKMLLANPTPIR